MWQVFVYQKHSPWCPSGEHQIDGPPHAVCCRVSGIEPACLWTATQTEHPQRHTQSVSRVCFQRKYFTHHHLQIKEVQQGPFIATEKGEIIWNVITKGKNEAQSSLFPRMPQSHTFLPWLTHVPLSPVIQAARDYEVVITSTTEEASSIPKCRQRRQLSCLVSRYTAQLSVRGLGL